MTYAISSTSLSTSLVNVYTNSLTFSCSSTGYQSATLSSASSYLYLPKGSMAYLTNSAANMQLAMKSDTQTPDYLANAASPYLLSNMSSPSNNQQIYFAVIATYIGNSTGTIICSWIRSARVEVPQNIVYFKRVAPSLLDSNLRAILLLPAPFRLHMDSSWPIRSLTKTMPCMASKLT